MSESDPIVDEVRRIRDANAAKFNYDPDAIFRDIKEREKQSGREYVSFADDALVSNQSQSTDLLGSINDETFIVHPQPPLPPPVELENPSMNETLIIPGRYSGRTFIPDGQLPDAEGAAELVITPGLPATRGSVVDAFGTAAMLRSGDEILAQMRAARDEWGDR